MKPSVGVGESQIEQRDCRRQGRLGLGEEEVVERDQPRPEGSQPHGQGEARPHPPAREGEDWMPGKVSSFLRYYLLMMDDL